MKAKIHAKHFEEVKTIKKLKECKTLIEFRVAILTKLTSTLKKYSLLLPCI